MEHGYWLTALTKRIILPDKQNNATTSLSDSTSPDFSTGDLVGEMYDTVYNNKYNINGKKWLNVYNANIILQNHDK